MYEKQPAGHTRLIPLTAALGLLAVLLVLLPSRVFAADPDFGSGHTTTISVPENTASGTDIGNAYTATDTDSADVLTYHLSGTDASSFSLGSSSSQLSTNTTLDYETKSSYSVTIGVRDNTSDTTDDDTIDITITVNNVDEDGTVSIMGTLDGGEELTASVSDLDGTVSSLTWKWSRGETATGAFTDIDSATNAKYTSVAADVGKFLRATATYKDPESTTVDKTAHATTSSAIAASNNEPTFSSMAATRTLPENSGAGVNVVGGTITATDGDSDMLTYSLASTGDHASFEINSNGQIKTKTGVSHDFDFESAKKSYDVTVNVRDNKDSAGDTDSAMDDSIDVTINLTDVNEAPTIDSGSSAFSKDENTATSVVIQTYQASDEDTPGTPQTLTWGLEGTDDGDFDINSSTGALTFKNVPNYEMPADGDGMNDYNVTVKVTDSGSPAKSDTLAVTVTVNNVNEAPTFDTTPGDFSKDENTPDTEVIASYSASDVDADDNPSNLNWTLLGEDANDFTLVKNSMTNNAELKFAAAPNFEMPSDDDDNDGVEGNNEYEITIKVADDGNLSVEESVTVTVTDVNETPVVSGDAGPNFAEIEYDDDGSTLTTTHLTVPGTYTFTDEDDDDVTWTLSGNDANHFEITQNMDGSSFIAFKNPTPSTTDKPADFENPVDTGPNNTYVFVVEATDDNTTVAPHNLKGTFNVTVTNVDETPEITAGSNSPSFVEIEY